MNFVNVAIAEAARAASLEELGTCAFAALARALDARPVFLGEVARDFVSSKAVAGEHQTEFRVYMRDYVLEDRLREVALARGLTRAETDVLAALVLGLTNSDIARKLCVSVETVKTHLYRAFRKLGVRSRTEALVFASKQ